MRIKRDYVATLRSWYGWFISRFKPLTVHTEAIFLDEVWGEIKKKVENNKVKRWYIMAPANYEYFKSSFNTRLNKKELSKMMKQRYLWMKEKNQRLELHIHLSLTMNNMTFKEQEKLFDEALLWMKQELNLTPKEFVPGWWSYNKDTIEILKKNNLKLIKERDYDYTHDFHWAL